MTEHYLKVVFCILNVNIHFCTPWLFHIHTNHKYLYNQYKIFVNAQEQTKEVQQEWNSSLRALFL